MVQTRQTGSVVSFVIIGGILVLAAAGVMYWAGQQRSDKTDIAKTPEVSVPSATNDSDKKQPDSSTNKPDADKSSPAAPGKSSEADKDKSSQDSSASNDQPAKNESKNNDSSSADNVNELSHTGPADTLAQLLAVGLLTASSVAFLQSRRQETTL